MPIVPPELHTHILNLYIESILNPPGCALMLRHPARVCTLWLERCRRELFKVVVIDGSYRNVLAWPRLLFLILNLHLATYVTTVRVRSASAAEDALECLTSGFPNVHTLMYEDAEFKPLSVAFVTASFFPKLTAFELTVPSLFSIGMLPRITPTFPAIHSFYLEIYIRLNGGMLSFQEREDFSFGLLSQLIHFRFRTMMSGDMAVPLLRTVLRNAEFPSCHELDITLYIADFEALVHEGQDLMAMPTPIIPGVLSSQLTCFALTIHSAKQVTSERIRPFLNLFGAAARPDVLMFESLPFAEATI